MGYITTSKNNATSFRVLVFCRIWIVVDFGVPVGGCPIGRLPQPELPPWTTRRSVLITRAVPRGAAWMVVGWSPMDWWQKQLCSSNGQFRVFLDVGLTRWHRSGRPWSFLWRRGRDVTCPERHIAAADGSCSLSLDWWYWKQARSTHWSKRSCCWTGWARSSTLIHLPWVNIQVLRKQSLGSDKPLGRFRK